MSGQFPFGFGSGSGGSGEGSGGSGGQGGFGFGDFGAGAPFFRELERLLSWQGGPINWELARQMAVQGASSESQPPSSDQQREVREAGRLADHWLDDATTLPGLTGTAEELASWSRTEWVERTLPVWQTICDPVAAKVVDAMGSGVTGGLASLGGLGGGNLELPPGLQLPEGMDLSSMLGDLSGPLTGMLRQIGGLLFGAQVGSALAALAGEVVGATDVGLPLGPPALLPHNVAQLAEGLEIPGDQVQLYVAVRELAHQRLFAHVPWLRSHLLGAVEDYARGITVDPEAIGRAVSQIDPTQLDPSSLDPERLSEMLGADAFSSPQTPEQEAALARLETALALVEGWVDEVTMAAVAGRLPSAASPCKRPPGVAGPPAGRRSRPSLPWSASSFVLAGSVTQQRCGRRFASSAASRAGTPLGPPRLLPSSDDLDDPAAFVAKPGDAMDPLAEIAKLAGQAPEEGSAETRMKDFRKGSGDAPGDDKPSTDR